MTVLVADKFEQSGLDGLQAAGCEVVYQPDLSGDALAEALRSTQASVVIVRSTQITEAMLDAGSLALIVRAGAGVNTIDLAGASKRGIYVSNCPGKNAIAVAELAMGLLLALDRRIPDNVADLRAGTWNKKEYSKARGLYGRTLGLLGFGNIGQEMARRAQAFGMRLLGNDIIPIDPEFIAQTGVDMVSLEALLDQSDFISVNCDLNPTSLHLLDAARLSRVRPGAILINCARGPVIDEPALVDALEQGRLGGAALDVFEIEPLPVASPLRGMNNVLLAPHNANSSPAAWDRVHVNTIRNLLLGLGKTWTDGP